MSVPILASKDNGRIGEWMRKHRVTGVLSASSIPLDCCSETGPVVAAFRDCDGRGEFVRGEIVVAERGANFHESCEAVQFAVENDGCRRRVIRRMDCVLHPSPVLWMLMVLPYEFLGMRRMVAR